MSSVTQLKGGYMQDKNLCPLCGEGQLTDSKCLNSVEYKGTTADINNYFSVCNACGSEQANAKQLRNNKRAMIGFKKQVDGLLTGIEVRLIREQLKITQAQASMIFGGGPVAFAKYEADDVTQSEAMDKLLRLAKDSLDAFSIMADRVGVAIQNHKSKWHAIVVEKKETIAKQGYSSRVINLTGTSENTWRNVA
jgi:HTH-type transcriptional regulator/antitoxin MqsA